MNELVFRGYLRPNGQAGVRNIVLVLHTVNCSRHVAAKICAQAREEGIPADAAPDRAWKCGRGFDRRARL